MVYKIIITRRKGILEGHAFYDTSEVAATVEIRKKRKLINSMITPFNIELRPGRYHMEVAHKAQTMEQDAEIKPGEKIVIEFPFKALKGTLECQALYDSVETPAVVEIYDKKTGELVEKKTTPFTIDLKEGNYRLKAIHPPPTKD